jgi:hypothetical protein
MSKWPKPHRPEKAAPKGGRKKGKPTPAMRKPLVRGALVIFFSVFFATTVYWAGTKCTPGFLGAANAGCVEFWFNRYQTLLAAIIALVAAYVASKVVWRQLAVQTFDTFQRYTELIERDRLLAWRCKREARLSLLFEQNASSISHPSELIAWQSSLIERVITQQKLREEIEAAGTREWSSEAGLSRGVLVTSLIQLGIDIDSLKHLIDTTLITHASGPIPSQWMVDKQRLKAASVKAASEALNNDADTFLKLANPELAKLRAKLDSMMASFVRTTIDL